MARKALGRPQERRTEGSAVRLSVSVDVLTWRRLRALAVIRDADCASLVAGWIVRETARVRLPSEATGESAESA